MHDLRLKQESVTIFYEGPFNKYFEFCRSYSPCHRYLSMPLYQEISHQQYISEWIQVYFNTKTGMGWVWPINCGL